MQALFTFCGTAYLLIYAFEGVIRYGLYSVGHDDLILLRDGLIIGPLLLLLVMQTFRHHIHPAFAIFAGIVAVHGAIATFNLGTTLPAIYGTKLLVNVLFGFIAGRQLTQPSRRMLLLLVAIWVISVTGVILDKFVYTFPWMGLETHVGGIQVDVSRGWDIDSGPDKRAAGFTRSSISAAMMLPILVLIIAPRVRSLLIRFVLLATTTVAVALTTQKGAMVAVAAVSLILCAPYWSRYRLLCIACVAFAILAVALPVMSTGLLIPDSGGVFSLASFAMRITLTWPDAWQWISNNQVFPFGVGLGGIGGAQRFYAANFVNPSDNLFVFLYANFGVFSLLYLGWIATIGRRLPRNVQSMAIPALAILAFNLGYGAALSMLEDQVSALFIGASAGMLWQLHQVARAGQWSNPFSGEPIDRGPSIAKSFHDGTVRVN
ncbi:hypothetical protein [Acidisphaera sp. S103]|uniref:hypothetical protein n=1 Tax=Acidisphaera sp. S103 TaxID=1747223 RepID=UPI00131CF754|nr:hypothetical protein [Acidisphaera sp. S103]